MFKNPSITALYLVINMTQILKDGRSRIHLTEIKICSLAREKLVE